MEGKIRKIAKYAVFKPISLNVLPPIKNFKNVRI